jgi:putative peptidoglycan lipid II flippase
LLVSVVINVALKLLLMGRYAQVGLALATSAGIWVNFVLLTGFAMRARLMHVDERLRASLAKFAVAGLALAAAIRIAEGPVMQQCESFGALRYGTALAALAFVGAVVYGGAIAIMFGPQWRRSR